MQKQNLSQSMTQKQFLSPIMQTTIKMLSLPTQELTELIDAELEANPFLERVSDSPVNLIDSVPEEVVSREAVEQTSDAKEVFPETSDIADLSLGTQLRQPDEYLRAKSDRFNEFLENTPQENSQTLESFLLEQLKLLDVPSDVQDVARVIISALEPSGFLPKDETALPTASFFYSKALKIVQSLEPLGVAQKSPKDALIFQAKKRENIPPHAIDILENHLEILQSANVTVFQKNLKKQGVLVSTEEAEEILAFFLTLNPIPGNGFGKGADIVVPDVVIHRRNGAIVSEWNADALPSLAFDNEATQLATGDKSVASFVKEYKHSAEVFISALKNRNESFRRTIAAVLFLQRDFFLLGPSYLKPLTLKKVADDIGFSESTVSRIADSKFIGTDWGVFPLKKLFSVSAVANPKKDTANLLSRESVKSIIAEILQSASGAKLSDQKLANLLAQRNIPISRRTVAKYRAELNISSSFERG